MLVQSHIVICRKVTVSLGLVGALVFAYFYSYPEKTAAETAISSKRRERICSRVEKRFANNEKALSRINRRLSKRFGFTCSPGATRTGDIDSFLASSPKLQDVVKLSDNPNNDICEVTLLQDGKEINGERINITEGEKYFIDRKPFSFKLVFPKKSLVAVKALTSGNLYWPPPDVETINLIHPPKSNYAFVANEKINESWTLLYKNTYSSSNNLKNDITYEATWPVEGFFTKESYEWDISTYPYEGIPFMFQAFKENDQDQVDWDQVHVLVFGVHFAPIDEKVLDTLDRNKYENMKGIYGL